MVSLGDRGDQLGRGIIDRDEVIVCLEYPAARTLSAWQRGEGLRARRR
jgi:hypothetical protein